MRICGGVVIMMTALWGGTYAIGRLDVEHWTACPTIITVLLVGVCGHCLLVWGLVDEA